MRAVPAMSPICHGGLPRYRSTSKSLGARKSRSRRVGEAGASEGEILEREAERLRVRELPLEEVEGGLERGELLVRELELREEVLLGAEGVQLLARELVALRLERHAEREEFRAVG